MENIDDFNTKVFQIIDAMDSVDLKKIHKSFYEKDFYPSDYKYSETDNDIPAIKQAIKGGIQRTSIEDLESIFPEKIKEIIQEYKTPKEYYGEDYSNQNNNQVIISQDTVNKINETEEQLIQEAISISAQRTNRNHEIPKDLQRRMGYVLSKLNIKFKRSKADIIRLVNLNDRTVDKYISDCLNAQPDLIELWGKSTEQKSIEKIDTSMAKTTADRAIQILRDNISLADTIREKYAIIAAQRGYNLYSSGDLEKLVNSAVQLYFQNDLVYQNIIALERENERLRQQISILHEENEEMEDIKILLLQ